MQENPDVVATYGNNPYSAYLHFVNHGAYEGRSCSPVFCMAVYQGHQPDLAGMTSYQLLCHFVTNGIYEGRDGTQTGFNVHEYASTLKLNNIIYVGKNTWKNYFYDYMFKLLAE